MASSWSKYSPSILHTGAGLWAEEITSNGIENVFARQRGNFAEETTDALPHWRSFAQGAGSIPLTGHCPAPETLQ